MALHHCEFGRGHDPPPPDRIAGESLPEQWKGCKPTARAAMYAARIASAAARDRRDG